MERCRILNRSVAVDAVSALSLRLKILLEDGPGPNDQPFKCGSLGSLKAGHWIRTCFPAASSTLTASRIRPWATSSSSSLVIGSEGTLGVVVGATVTGDGRAHDLSRLNGPVLAPGIGAQGGTAADLAAVFGDAVGHVLPSTSREVLGAGPSVSALRDAAARALDAVGAVLR